MNDRNPQFHILGIVDNHIIAEYSTGQKVKVGITHIPGHNSNFFHDTKKENLI